jgi:glycine/D-amino acid oxidase-like deaminating enzyme
MKKIIVVGAGIIGASLSFPLAKAGAEVLVLDALADVGGVATPNSWAWVNASWGNAPDYVRLRMRAMAEWRNLTAVDKRLNVKWCGGLLWDLPEDELRNFVKDRKAVGYDVELVDGEAARRVEPRLSNYPQLAAYAACEGAIEPVLATHGFITAAKTSGARIIHNIKIDDFLVVGDRITGVRAGGSLYEADEVVLAVGAATKELLAKIGLTLQIGSPPGLLVHSEPCKKILNGLVMAPELHVRQTSEGRLVAGSDFGGAQPGDDPAATAKALFQKLCETLQDAKDLKLDFFTLGFRPTPSDGMPGLGRPHGIEGLYVCVTHSGVTLAPALGNLCSAEIMTGVRDLLLYPFHIDRLCS